MEVELSRIMISRHTAPPHRGLTSLFWHSYVSIISSRKTFIIDHITDEKLADSYGVSTGTIPSGMSNFKPPLPFLAQKVRTSILVDDKQEH